MRSTKGVVTVTKGERRRSRKVRGRNETENDSVVGGKRARRGIQREKAKERERGGGEKERKRRARNREREGMIFAREGCATRHAAAQRRPLRPFRQPRAFSSLFLALLASRPLFFLPGHRRGARAFHPRGPRRFFFSSVCAATPPRHNGRVPENSSLGRRPFPRPPRLFRRFPSRYNPLFRAPSAPFSPLRLRGPSALFPLPVPRFFSS